MFAQRYLGQVQYHFNRRFDLRTMLERLARAASQAALCPLRAVRAVEPSRRSGEFKGSLHAGVQARVGAHGQGWAERGGGVADQTLHKLAKAEREGRLVGPGSRPVCPEHMAIVVWSVHQIADCADSAAPRARVASPPSLGVRSHFSLRSKRGILDGLNSGLCGLRV